MTHQIEIDKNKLEKFHERLQKGAVIKAIKGWKNSNIPFETIEPDLLRSIDKAFQSHNGGIILSAYYELGKFSNYEITDLLNLIFNRKDYPTFLKQAYRFGIYNGFEDKVDFSLKWHEEKNLPDAFAWKLKFEKIKESLKIINQKISFEEETDPGTQTLKIIDEEQSTKSKDIIYFELKPLKRKENISIKKSIEEVEEQPYILSLVSKKKLENANQKHFTTLEILKNELVLLNYEVIETKHIDLFSIINDEPAIFEVKSINEENENDQVRAAISQLYEYRFLYALKKATLWIVFSEKPFSNWIIEYLMSDREIKILWIEDGKLAGYGISQLHK